MHIKGAVPVDFFNYTFYAIMHRTTIVQNKIINSICYFFFVRLIFIGLVQGRCCQVGLTQSYLNQSIFISEGKKHSTQNLYALQHLASDFQFSFQFIFKKIFLKMHKKIKIFNYIYNNNINFIFFENQTPKHCCEVFADVNTIYFTTLRCIMNEIGLKLIIYIYIFFKSDTETLL